MAKPEPEKLNKPSNRLFYECDEQVPVGLRCPRCNQNHQIVMSGLQKRRGPLKRLMFYYFRCGVCDCRFRHPNSGVILTFLFGGAAMITAPIVFTLLNF